MNKPLGLLKSKGKRKTDILISVIIVLALLSGFVQTLYITARITRWNFISLVEQALGRNQNDIFVRPSSSGIR